MEAVLNKIIKTTGIKSESIETLYAWIPYNLFPGTSLPPIKVTMEVTYRCNLNCAMCPQVIEKEKRKEENIPYDYAKGELPESEIKTLIKDFRKTGVKAITLTGGEPFLRRDILNIIKEIKNRGFYLSIITNGTLIDKNVADKLVSIGVDTIGFSIDGPVDIHNKIRRVPKTFEKASHAIKLIKDAKQNLAKKCPKIVINCTILADNQGRLNELVDVAKDLDVDHIDFSYLFFMTPEAVSKTSKMLPIANLKLENQMLPPRLREIDFDVLSRDIAEVKEKAKICGLNIGFSPPLNEKERRLRFSEKTTPYVKKCFYPWYETRIDPYGNVYPCTLDVSMGNIKENSISDIWNGNRYRKFRRGIKKQLPPMCAKCCKLTNKMWDRIPCLR